MKYLNHLRCYFGWHQWLNQTDFHRHCSNCHEHQMRNRHNMDKWYNMTKWVQHINKPAKIKGRLLAVA